MDFIKYLLIVDKKIEMATQLKSKMRAKTTRIQVLALNSRSQVAEVVTKNPINCLILNTNIGKKDTSYILRFFSMMREKNNLEFSIYLISEDFELLQETVTEFSNEKLQIVTTPVDLDSLVDKIQIATLGKIVQASEEKVKNKKLNVDVEFMNVFINATKNVISQMAQLTDLKHSLPLLMGQLKAPLKIDISAKILISSEYFKGSYFICFPKETFFKFYEIVVMEKCTEINSENKDFASELANIIYGQCKKVFSEQGFNLEMVIPSLHLGGIVHGVVIVIPFECSLGTFYLAIAPGLI